MKDGIKFHNMGGGVYEVSHYGKYVGDVSKHFEYYNLHPRPATYTVWRMHLPEKGLLSVKDSSGRPRNFGTRHKAAEALINLEKKN